MAARIHVMIALLLAGALPAVFGCSSNSNPTSPESTPDTTSTVMTAAVDGAPWVADTATAIESNGLITVSGTLTGDLTLAFLFSDAGPATYTIEPPEITSASVTDQAGNHWVAEAGSGSGIITVDTLTTDRISGTFQFRAALVPGATGQAERVVAGGVFDLKLVHRAP